MVSGWVRKPTTTNEGKTMTRPTKDMTKTKLTREQMLALFQDDEALRTLVQTTVQEVLEGEMDKRSARAKASAPANAGAIAAATTAAS
jgi:hypothetical protein